MLEVHHICCSWGMPVKACPRPSIICIDICVFDMTVDGHISSQIYFLYQSKWKLRLKLLLHNHFCLSISFWWCHVILLASFFSFSFFKRKPHYVCFLLPVCLHHCNPYPTPTQIIFYDVHSRAQTKQVEWYDITAILISKWDQLVCELLHKINILLYELLFLLEKLSVHQITPFFRC